jgi:tRNA (mo5U34)-methyltransferase
MNADEIIEKATSLRPWHFDFEIVPGVKARSLNDPNVAEPDHKGVGVVDPSGMDQFFKSYWPGGLMGKDVLDAACNAGAYCFRAHEFGARSATGFDARKHWIDQAEFIRSLKYPDADNVRFEIADAKAFLSGTPRSFDITIFKGILYHLPDPIGVLLQFCQATREVMLVDTASSDKVPEDCLVPFSESTTHVMSGIDGLAWLPGGPAAIRRIMEYAGFRKFEVVFWRHGDIPGRGRFQLIGSRTP